MPNEDIVTALRNAIEHGEDLQSAVQVMINSGYNPAEVKEASKFIHGGVMPSQQIKPEEQLTMPNQKKPVLSKFKPQKSQQTQPLQPPKQQPMIQQQVKPLPKEKQIPQAPSQQIPQQVKQNISLQTLTPQKASSEPLTKQINKIKPKSKHTKEIILLIVLLILIGLLITTIVFKNTILGWFS